MIEKEKEEKVSLFDLSYEQVKYLAPCPQHHPSCTTNFLSTKQRSIIIIPLDLGVISPLIHHTRNEPNSNIIITTRPTAAAAPPPGLPRAEPEGPSRPAQLPPT